MTKKSKDVRLKQLMRLGICVALIALIALIGVVTANAEIYSGECGALGDNVIWTLDTETGSLVIAGEGYTEGYSQYVNPSWSPYQNYIKEAKLSSGILNVGHWLFYGCKNLEKVTLPESVTQIEFTAFSGCSSLRQVNIPSGVTVIDSSAFYGCSSLETVEIPYGVTTIRSSAFACCRSLRSIDIPDSVTEIQIHAFSGCNELQQITLSNNLAVLGKYAFSACYGLSEITLPSTLVSIGDEAFMACDGLTDVYYDGSLTKWNCIAIGEGNECLLNATLHLKTVESQGLVFTSYGNGTCYISGRGTCTDADLIIPAFSPDGDRVTRIKSETFANCSWLTSVTIPECVTSVGYAAFSGCGNLMSINLPKNLTTIEAALFMNCENLTNVNIPEGVTMIGVLAFRGCHKLPQTENGVSYVGKWVVGYVGDITSVTLREGTVGICEAAFDGCHSLTDIHMPESVKYIGTSAFENCDQLTSVTVPSGVRKINWYVFASCERLAEIRLPDGLESIGLGAFYDCKSLTDIRIPATVQMIGYEAFDGCPDQLFRKEGGAIYVDTWVYYCADDTVYLRKDVAGFYWYAFGYETELYFLGTEKEWNALPGTDKNCTVHCLGDLFDLTSASLTLGTSLTMNYYAKADPTCGTPAMRFTYRGETETVMGVPTETEDEYVFSLKGIAPQCMGENIKAELILTLEDGTELVVDAKESYSVRAYCDDALAANPNNKTLATLLADLLAYGDAAQDYANYNEDTPVSEGFAAAPSEWEDVTDTDFTLSDKTRDDIRFTAAGVRFAYVNRLYFKLKAADLTGVTLTVNGKTYTAEDLALVEDTADTYILYTDPVYATEFDKVFTADLSVDGEVIQTLTYSVKSYVYAKQNGENAEMAALARALYAYGRSAIAYKQEQ